MSLVVDGRHIALLERGEGPPVVLVHASGMGSLQWGPVAPRLADRWRVLAPDLLGCGASDPWPDRDAYTLDADLAVVRAVVAYAGEPVHLVGHSFGGLLALRLAAEDPSRVRSVAVYEPVAFGVLEGHGPDSPAAAGAADLALSVDASFLDPETGGDTAWVGRFINFWNGAGTWDAMAPARRAALESTGRKSFLEVRALLAEPGGLAHLRSPRPTLVMSGTRSPLAARAVCRVLAEGLPDARLEVFDGAGHMAPIEEAKRFVRVLAEHLAAN